MEAAEYQAAAIAQLTGTAPAETPEAPTEAAPPQPGEATPTEPPATGDETATPPPAEGETTEAEAKTEPPTSPEAAKVDQKLSAKFEALSKEARATREARAQFERDVAAAKAQLQAESQSYEKYRKAEQLLAAGKHGAAMRAMGLVYEKMTQDLIAGKDTDDSLPQEDPVKAEVNLLKQQLAEIQREKIDMTQKARISEFKSSARDFAKSKGDDYELTLNEPDGMDRVYRKVVGLVQAQPTDGRGVPLPIEITMPDGETRLATDEEIAEAALAMVERELEEKTRRRLQTKKFGAKVENVALKEAPRPASQLGSTSPRTLTNSQAVAAPRSAPPEPRTPEEYREAALKVLLSGG